MAERYTTVTQKPAAEASPSVERTQRLADPEPAPISLGQERPVTLLVYHPSRVEAVVMEEGQGLVIGRGGEADLTVEHPGLSAEHASVERAEDGVWIEDLGSTNGTWVNGERLDHTRRVRIRPGDRVLLGAVALALHAPLEAGGPVQRLHTHDRYLELLDEELARHRFFGRKLGLLFVRAARPDAALSDWWERVQGHLRPVDRAGLYSPSVVEICVAEVESWEPLLALAERIVAAPAAKGSATPLCCGAALFPEAGTSAPMLLDAARTAASGASEARPVKGAPTTTSHQLITRPKVVVRSTAMQQLYATCARMSRSTIPVLILGETGAGKELVAQAIHEGSGRKGLPCVNCAAVPDSLIESIMFGHEKGAFTGADRQTVGVFEEADGGSVFLDEVGELSPAAQAALLRVLDTKRITRVGSAKEIPVNVRVLAATHRNLEAMCDAGTFRRDLLYRINTMTVRIPPLRERLEEIAPLARRFLTQAAETNECLATELAPEVFELLSAYRWPGNVRELRNVVFRAAVLATGPTITPAELPERVRRPGYAAAPLAVSLSPALAPAADGAEAYKERVQRFEVGLLREALEAAGWNKTLAAQNLRIPLRTLLYKIKSFGIVPAAGA